jgi:hypothetical protein
MWPGVYTCKDNNNNNNKYKLEIKCNITGDGEVADAAPPSRRRRGRRPTAHPRG